MELQFIEQPLKNMDFVLSTEKALKYYPHHWIYNTNKKEKTTLKIKREE
jgi:hypothetical protein